MYRINRAIGYNSGVMGINEITKRLVIVARAAIRDGFGGAFDLSLDPPKHRRSPADDLRNIQSYWARTGDHIYNAIDRHRRKVMIPDDHQLSLFDSYDAQPESEDERREEHQPA